MSATRSPAALRGLRDAWVVARFDLGESLRSRKVLIFLALYAAGAVAAAVIFTEVLQDIEEALAEQLLVARTSQPGSLTQAVMEAPELRLVLVRLVRDEELADALLRVPPIALLYHWVALTFAPVFVVFTSSDAISGEVSTGSVRYALFRTDRTSWAAGKLLGQTLLSGVGLALGAVGAWIVGYLQLASFAPLETAAWLARYVVTAFFFAFAHLGLALGVSQLTRSVPWSRALGLFALAFVFGAHGWLGRDAVQEEAPVLAASLQQVFPAAHRLDLWRPSLWDGVVAMTVLAALGFVYFAIGHLRFARRDA
ncbi:MAG: ABC transporter permease subunit [Myxococcota bacterium]|nr:ABC transporter permease subunit [Myxococcota bacterium]